MFSNFPLKHSSSNQIYSVYVHFVKHVTSTENNIVYFLFYSEKSFETLIGERFAGAAIEGVSGVAWFNGKIYIVFFEQKKLFVFSDKVPFDELKDAEKLIIDKMEFPFDMVASERSKALFISDSDTRHQCLWKINLRNTPEISQNDVEEFEVQPLGKPYTLSIMPSGDLLVIVKYVDVNGTRWCLNVYNPENVMQIRRIEPGYMLNVDRIVHAVQISENIEDIIVSWKELDSESYRIDRITITGEFKSRYSLPANIQSFKPEYLSVDRDDVDNIIVFIADDGKSQVFRVNISDCSILQILPVNTVNKKLLTPLRLCYLSESKKLIVTQSRAIGYGRDQRSLIIFDLNQAQMAAWKRSSLDPAFTKSAVTKGAREWWFVSSDDSSRVMIRLKSDDLFWEWWFVSRVMICYESEDSSCDDLSRVTILCMSGKSLWIIGRSKDPCTTNQIWSTYHQHGSLVQLPEPNMHRKWLEKYFWFVSIQINLFDAKNEILKMIHSLAIILLTICILY